MDDTSQGDFYNIPPTESKKSSRKNPFLILVIIMVLGIIGFGAYTFIAGSSDGGKTDENITPTPTQAPTPTPEPSPTPEISTTPAKATPTTKATSTPTKSAAETTDKTSGLDRADLTIEVLNGSGTAGVAGKMKSTLEGLGYKVGSTGNADNFEYTNTTIEVKAVKKNFLDLLKKDLSASYTIGTTSATFSGSADARVIVGKQ